MVKMNKTLEHKRMRLLVTPIEKFQKVDPLKRTNQIMTYYKCIVDKPTGSAELFETYEDIFEKRYLENEFEELKCK